MSESQIVFLMIASPFIVFAYVFYWAFKKQQIFISKMGKFIDDKAQSIKLWHRVSATIIESQINTKSNRPGEKISYRPDIVYSYTYRSKDYTNDQFAPVICGRIRKKEVLQKYLKSFEAGKVASIYVNPKNPQNAYLFPILDLDKLEQESSLSSLI